MCVHVYVCARMRTPSIELEVTTISCGARAREGCVENCMVHPSSWKGISSLTTSKQVVRKLILRKCLENYNLGLVSSTVHPRELPGNRVFLLVPVQILHTALTFCYHFSLEPWKGM